MEPLRQTTKWLAGFLTLAVVSGCADGTGVPGPQQVSLGFRVTGPAGPTARSSTGPAQAGGPASVAGPPMVLTGTNGTLRLDEIRIVINEVELKRADPSCDSVEVSGSDCGEFEAPPRFLDIPLDGQPIEAVTALIPPGTYKELDFEIEDLEDDESDPTEAALVAAVRAEILAVIPDWPRKASAMVAGAFTPNGGPPNDFRVFLEAEIEIEFELVPNLVVDDAGAASRQLTVDVAPHIWFTRPDGSVLDLSLYDYDATQDLLEFEVEMEGGFIEVEIED